MWTDLHAHLGFLTIGPDQAVQNAKSQGLKRVITIGTDVKDWDDVVRFCTGHPGYVFGTIGVHPCEAHLWNAEAAVLMERLLQEDFIVAGGELGLDYHYPDTNKDLQHQAMRSQLELVRKFDMPCEVHSRDAEMDTVSVLKEHLDLGGKPGVIHCFSGSSQFAKDCLDLGFALSISGIVTFKKATELREIVKSAPLRQLFVETDSPYLSPAPLRGVENQPSHVLHTAKLVAELKGLAPDELSEALEENLVRYFPKISSP